MGRGRATVLETRRKLGKANFVSLLQLAAETKDQAPRSPTHGCFYCLDFLSLLWLA